MSLSSQSFALVLTT